MHIIVLLQGYGTRIYRGVRKRKIAMMMTTQAKVAAARSKIITVKTKVEVIEAVRRVRKAEIAVTAAEREVIKEATAGGEAEIEAMTEATAEGEIGVMNEATAEGEIAAMKVATAEEETEVIKEGAAGVMTAAVERDEMMMEAVQCRTKLTRVDKANPFCIVCIVLSKIWYCDRARRKIKMSKCLEISH